MKYSFIVPVYNGEFYIDRCLPSLVNQTYDNFEIILINDGSTDNSLSKLKGYQRKYQQIKLYSTKNSGPSSARNYGIKKATGEYIIFVDIDDYINKKMLNYLETIIKNNFKVDVIKYQYLAVNKVIDVKEEINLEIKSELLDGCQAFVKLVKNKIPFDMNCIYAFKSSYFKGNKFKFEVGKYYEDFGLIPYIILKSKKVILINKVLYYYVQSQDSVMRNKDYQKQIKKFNDLLYHFDNYLQKIINDSSISVEAKKIFFSYVANAVIMRYRKLNKKDRLILKNEIDKRKIVDLLLSDSIGQKLKKIIYKIML